MSRERVAWVTMKPSSIRAPHGARPGSRSAGPGPRAGWRRDAGSSCRPLGSVHVPPSQKSRRHIPRTARQHLLFGRGVPSRRAAGSRRSRPTCPAPDSRSLARDPRARRRLEGAEPERRSAVSRASARAARASASRSRRPTLITESVPIPTRSPASSSAPSGAAPWPWAAFDSGQWATGSACERARSVRSRRGRPAPAWMQSVRSAEHPVLDPARPPASGRGAPAAGSRGRARRRRKAPVPRASSSVSAARFREMHRRAAAVSAWPNRATAREQRPAHRVGRVGRDARCAPGRPANRASASTRAPQPREASARTAPGAGPKTSWYAIPEPPGLGQRLDDRPRVAGIGDRWSLPPPSSPPGPRGPPPETLRRAGRLDGPGPGGSTPRNRARADTPSRPVSSRWVCALTSPGRRMPSAKSSADRVRRPRDGGIGADRDDPAVAPRSGPPHVRSPAPPIGSTQRAASRRARMLLRCGCLAGRRPP